MDARGLGLKDQVLLAAMECAGGNCEKAFTAEDLLVRAWEKDKPAWGLRGYEQVHPDADKIHKEIDGRGAANKGMVGLGYVQRAENRVYRLTPSGLAAGSRLRPADPIAREKAGRRLEQEIKQILEHPALHMWLQNPELPKYFRDAGHFWGIAPGMPTRTIEERIRAVEGAIEAAAEYLGDAGVEEVTEQRGRILFERADIERARAFQQALKTRFSRDLALLGRKPKSPAR
jgi:hypothetical protein